MFSLNCRLTYSVYGHVLRFCKVYCLVLWFGPRGMLGIFMQLGRFRVKTLSYGTLSNHATVSLKPNLERLTQTLLWRERC